MFKPELYGKVIFDADMRKYTSFGIGGKADMLFLPDSAEAAVQLLTALIAEGIPYTVLGGGTNVLVRDGGIRGATVLTGSLTGFAVEGETVTAGAGVPLAGLSRVAAEEGLSGLEWACGIPGTLGGAVAGNAGAFGDDIGSVVYSADVFSNGGVSEIHASQCGFDYRSSVFQISEDVILSVRLKMAADEKSAIAGRMADANRRRQSCQPRGVKSAGSAFKALIRGAAGKLIDQCGLKGLRIGGAEVSRIHANFFINAGGATARDMLELADTVKNILLKEYGEAPELEWRIIGEG